MGALIDDDDDESDKMIVDCADEVTLRMAMSIAMMVKLTKNAEIKSMSTITKLRLMKALAWLIVAYGCEA